MIHAIGLSKSFETPVFSDLSFSLPETGLVLIRGESGSGKTTLLRILAGLETPDSGELKIKDGTVFSVVFQEARLAEHLTLLENVLLVKKEKDKKRALEILDFFQLADAAEKLSSVCSSLGEKHLDDEIGKINEVIRVILKGNQDVPKSN